MTPFALVRGALADAGALRQVSEAVDADPAWRRDGPPLVRFNPHSSSLRAADVAGLDLPALAGAVLHGPAGPACRALVGDAVALDLDQCWVRRQYAPHRYPALHAPHAWHQDGALGFDFMAPDGAAAEGLLAMATCWIALTPCGEQAPGLELVAEPDLPLLRPEALADEAVSLRHGREAMHRPRLAPGDALVFGGGVLHHTHVAPSMTGDRTSLELRFFPAAQRPARLYGDRFLELT